MHPIVILEIISLIATCLALVLLLRKGRYVFSAYGTYLSALTLLSVAAIHYLCLALQWSDSALNLDPIKDATGVLMPALWLGMIYGFSSSTREQGSDEKFPH
ncbi:MAG: hypothetical protein HON65_08295 [Rhodospirillales bacterium]|jgi:hypothetical protein|nr:hypothetical protein [Rhodospirillales bacterium]